MPGRQASRLPTTAEKLGLEPSQQTFYWFINTPDKKTNKAKGQKTALTLGRLTNTGTLKKCGSSSFNFYEGEGGVR